MATTTVTESNITTREGTIKTIKAAGTPIYRVVADGNIIYDRKDYVLLAASDYRYIAPITGGTITFPSTAITSTFDGYNASGVRVNGASVDYSKSPASLTSNAHNTATRSGNITVVQDNSELEVTVPYTQAADSHDEGTPVCTSMTITVVDVPDIPASGGSVNSCDISVQANGYLDYEWASGGHSVGPSTSWTLSSSDYTASWTGVTAQSKGTVPSPRTELQNKLICLVTLNADHSITARREITVYQSKNGIRGYTEYTYNLIVETNITGTYTAAGGNVYVYYTAQRSRKPIYDSNASGATITTNAAAELATNIGTITPYSVSGVDWSVLEVPANTTQLRTITITLTSTDDATQTATTSFNQYASSAVFAYAYLSDYTGYGQLNTWEQVHAVSQDISNWSSPSQNVYQVSADGNVRYRLDQDASAQLVPADTYFYNNDSLTFHTRNVTTSGAEGTEHLWYKNPTFSFTVPSIIPASATTFTMSGSTSYVKYYVTVYEAGSPIMNKTLYTGGNLTVQCSANTSTATTRVFTVSFEDYYNAENAEMNSKQVTQEAKVANSISVDINEWTICTNTIPGARANFVVTSVGGGWNASYDSRYFTVSPASGSEGDTRVTVTAIAQGPDGTKIYFVHSILSVGRARVDIIYDTSC